MGTAPAPGGYAMELAQQYPEQARDLSAGLSVAESVPFCKRNDNRSKSRKTCGRTHWSRLR